MAQPKETAGSKIVKQISMQEFLETQSLYTKTDVAVPTLIHNLFPEVLVLHCEICNDTRPFRYPFSRGSGAGHMPEQVEHAGIYSCHVRCTGCQQQSFTCWVRVSLTPKTWVEKVGQYPSVASLSLQRHLKNMLFYHKGLQVHKTPLPFVAYARKTAILRGQIWSARKSGVVGLV